MPGCLLDLDGVLYQQGRPLPGAAQTVAWLRRRRLPHLFLTNTSSRPHRDILQRLAGYGLDIPADSLLTPAMAAAAWLREQPLAGPVALLTPAATRADFADLPLAEGTETKVGAVVVGDMGAEWTYPRLNQAFRWLMQEPRPLLVALGMTRYWRAEEGLRLDVAPFVTALAHAADVTPVVLGKPAALFFRAALRRLELRPEAAVMVGDDLRSDVGGAQRAGLLGVLVRTGKFRPSDLEGPVRADGVLDSIADLPDWWTARFGTGSD